MKVYWNINTENSFKNLTKNKSSNVTELGNKIYLQKKLYAALPNYDYLTKIPKRKEKKMHFAHLRQIDFEQIRNIFWTIFIHQEINKAKSSSKSSLLTSKGIKI